MKRWEVEWTGDAEAQMGKLLYNSSDGSALMKAASTIEQALEQLPDGVGESREADHRIVIEPPLAIYCHVYPDRSLVSIYAVWRWANKKR